MTNKEAIETINVNYPDECYTMLREALDIAIKALEKQEPVEPKFIDGKRNHFILCGNCNTDLMRGMKFCSYCGQAVKWK